MISCTIRIGCHNRRIAIHLWLRRTNRRRSCPHWLLARNNFRKRNCLFTGGAK